MKKKFIFAVLLSALTGLAFAQDDNRLNVYVTNQCNDDITIEATQPDLCPLKSSVIKMRENKEFKLVKNSGGLLCEYRLLLPENKQLKIERSGMIYCSVERNNKQQLFCNCGFATPKAD